MSSGSKRLRPFRYRFLPMRRSNSRSSKYRLDNMVFEFQPDRLYVPYSSTNRVAFNSFINTGEVFYIFQIATSDYYEHESVHDVDEGIEDLFSEEVLRALPPKTMPRLDFLVAPGEKDCWPRQECGGEAFGRSDTVYGRIWMLQSETQGLTC